MAGHQTLLQYTDIINASFEASLYLCVSKLGCVPQSFDDRLKLCDEIFDVHAVQIA